MTDFDQLLKAANHRGFEVQRLTPAGWVAITGTPFAMREAAVSYLAGLDPADGEHRVYPSLAPRRVRPVPEPGWPFVANG